MFISSPSYYFIVPIDHCILSCIPCIMQTYEPFGVMHMRFYHKDLYCYLTILVWHYQKRFVFGLLVQCSSTFRESFCWLV